MGWRIHTSALDAVGGYALMIAFSFAIIWVGVLLGSLLPSPEAVQGVAFVVIFPITFIASTFVPVETLPGRAADGRRVEPGHDHLRGAARALRQPERRHPTATRPGRSSTRSAYTLIWIVAIVVVCAPLAIRTYQRTISD